MHNLLFIGKSVHIDYYMSKLDYGKRCGIIVVLFGLGVGKGTVMQLAAGVVNYMGTTIKCAFRSKNFWLLFTVALSLLFGKICPIMD